MSTTHSALVGAAVTQGRGSQRCRKPAWLVALLSALSLAAVASETAQPPKIEPPFARVALLPSAPPMDSPRLIYSWQYATAFCGMLNVGAAGEPRYLGSGYDAGWWVAYHQDTLYLAMMIPTPDATTFFRADATRDGDSRIAADDHLVVHLSLRDRAGAAAGPSLRIRLNINGAILAEEVEFLPGQTRALATDTIGKLVSDKQEAPGANWFTAKLAIPAALLGLKSLDDQTLLAHLAFSATPLYLSWGGARPGEWNRAGEIRCDPAMPANIRLNPSHPRLFSTLAASDKLSLNVGAGGVILRGDGGKVILQLTSRAEETALFSQALSFADVGKEKKYRLPLQTTFAVKPAVVNHFAIHAVHTDAEGKETSLLRQSLPFRVGDDAILGQLAAWRAARKKTQAADFDADYIYAPYTDQLEATVDTAVVLNALAETEQAKGAAIAAADGFAVELRADGGARIAGGTAPVAANRGYLKLALPAPFAAGVYSVEYRLLKGGQEVHRKTLRLTRERFAWEKNNVGRDKVVIPPFTPVAVAGNAVSVIGRRQVFGDSGFPVSITTQGAELLAGPVTLQGRVAGADAGLVPAGTAQIAKVPGTVIPASWAAYEFVKGACPVPEPEPTDGYQATVAARGSLGPLQVQVNAVVEYEGWCRFTIGLRPQGPTQVEHLDLVIPLADSATIMKWWRGYDSQLTGVGRIPAGDGVLFTSLDLPRQPGLLNSLTPIVYLGEPDRGLWAFVETEEGWVTDDRQPLTSLVRENGRLSLRYHVVNRPVEIAEPRTFEIVLMASPARPRPANYRAIFWKQLYSHDAAGFRFYGSGVNGFTLYTDEDYAGLRTFIYESEGRYARKAAMARLGAPMTLYGAISSASAGMKEFATFGSSWVLTANLRKQFMPEIQFKGRKSNGGTYTYETDEQLTPIATTMDAAYIDCNLWHMTEIARRCGINGTFYDNYKPFAPERFCNVTDLTGVYWRRPDGTVQPKSNVFRRHEWQKRVSTAFWLLGRPPHQICGNEPDSTFASNWFVEGVNDVEGGSDFIKDGKDLARYAAWLACTGGLGQAGPSIQTVTDAQGRKTDNLRGIRVATAYCLLLDQPMRRKGHAYETDAPVRDVCEALDREVGFFADAVHLPFWRDTAWLRQAPPGLAVGGFRRADGRKAVLVVLNTGETEVDGTVQIDATRLLGGTATRTVDLETPGSPNLLRDDRIRVTLSSHAVRYWVVE